jgi:exonuclease SbcD
MMLDELLKRSPKGPRFAYITDLHARNRAPKMRKDNYREALIDKLNWVCKAAQALGCSNKIIGGGDIFDVPKVNLDVADDLVDVFVKYNMELWTVFGNHDLESSLASAPSVVLGHLMRRASAHIRPLPVFGSRPLTIDGIDIWGHHYRYANQSDDLYLDVRGDKPRVIVSHSMILKEKPNWDESSYQLYDEITTNAHLLLLGHYHPQQPLTRLSNDMSTIVAAPGALMRGSLSRDDLQRRPSMAICEWDTYKEDFIVDYVPIECAQPAEAVFRIEEAQAEAKKNDAMDSFRLELDDMKVQGDSIAAIIEKIVAQENIPEDVRQETLRRIGAI